MVVVGLSSANKFNNNNRSASKRQPQQQMVVGQCGAGQQRQQQRRPIVAARLLWLGDKQVGKSAAIVRYTTGRFIQEYSSGGSSNDWLYYYKLPATSGAAKQQPMSASLVELLEQKDIQFSNSGNFFESTTTESQTAHRQTAIGGGGEMVQDAGRSLSSRVALDQLIDQELHEKQQMLERLRWADAYIVMYSISDIQSFQKAIKYLNLIANNINSPSGGATGAAEQHNGSGSGGSSSSSSGCGVRNSPPATQTMHSQQACKRPILLLGNKRDLERGAARQVQALDGRHLAIRHQSMFAEVSVAQTGRQLEQLLSGLLELIEAAPVGSQRRNSPTNLEHLITSCTQQQQQLGGQRKSSYPLMGLWRTRRNSSEPHQSRSQLQYTMPARAILVKSQPVCARPALVQSCRLLVSGVGAREPNGARGNLNAAAAASSTIHSPTTSAGVSASCSEVTKLKGSLEATVGRPPLSQYRNLKATNVMPLKSSSGAGRYEHFKSSFRKASMAIVGGRALNSSAGSGQVNKKGPPGSAADELPSIGADNSAPEEAAAPLIAGGRQRNLLVNQPASSSSTSSSSQISMASSGGGGSGSANWLRQHIRLNRAGKVVSSLSSSSELAADGSASAATPPAGTPISTGETLSERIKRPLLKYKNRRKTVAFEQISAAAAAPIQSAGSRFSGASQRKPSLASIAAVVAPTGLAGGSFLTSFGSGEDTSASCHSSLSLVSAADTPTYPSSSHTLLAEAACGTPARGRCCQPAASSQRTADSHRAPSSLGSASVCSSSCYSPVSSNAAASGGRSSSDSNATDHRLIDRSSLSATDDSTTTNNIAAVGQQHNYSSTRPAAGTLSAGDELSVDDEQQQQSHHHHHHYLVASEQMDGRTGAAAERQLADTAIGYAIERIGLGASSEVATICEVSGRRNAPIKLAPVPSCASPSHAAATATKKRYQLVKSVHNTLTNLTRSSNVAATGQTTPTKRSFCTGLFRSQTSQSNGGGATAATALIRSAEPKLAKTDQVHSMPLIVGYCK